MKAGPTLRRVMALGRYGLANNLRTPHTWAGFMVLAAMALLGGYIQWRNTGVFGLHDGFLVNGAYLAAVFILRSGIVAQRERGLQTFLRMNFVSPAEHVSGAVVSLVGCWLFLAVAVLVTALILPGAAFGRSAWYGWNVALGLGLLLPFVLLTELVSTLEVPLLVPGLLFMVFFMAVYVLLGMETALRLSAPVQAGSFASTEARAIRAAVSCGVGFGAIIAWTAIRPRRE